MAISRKVTMLRKWAVVLLLFAVVYLFTALSLVQVIGTLGKKDMDQMPCHCESPISRTDESRVNLSRDNSDNAPITALLSVSSPLSKVDPFIKIATKFIRIDWNNYSAMAAEALKQGPGEQGTAVDVTQSASELDTIYEKFKYNAYLTDLISLLRSIGDLRSDACKKQPFLRDIPENSVSFVIVFHNERNRTLLRTVHGIVNRSPPKLLREIVLVDDFSVLEELKAPLDMYISQNFTKVKVIRNQERLGLIRSRVVGADATSGLFLVFMDAHVEVNHNFLPPLLEPMILNYKTITCPMIDFINARNFQVTTLEARVRGVFDWDMTYQRIFVYDFQDEVTPHPSPVMLGCAFAITRRWWEELGKFDPGLQIWGAEQYELSLKSWQCGGSVVDAPCSRAAHLFRPLPYVKEIVNDSIIEKNYQRLTSVWMDEYKKYVLERVPRMRQVDPGDITAQLELRKRLNCKPFKWFMEVVAPDVIKHYPLIVPPLIAWGRIISSFNTSLCVVIKNYAYGLDDCSKESAKDFVLNWRLRIRKQKSCMSTSGRTFEVWGCIDIETRASQSFLWDRQNGRIVSVLFNLCLDVDPNTLELFNSQCNKTRPTQSWHFEGFNATEVDRVWALHASKLPQVVLQ